MITAGFSHAFRLLLLSLVESDEYRLALYDSTAVLDKTTPAYTTVGEVAGPGYTAGGEVMTGAVAAIENGVAYLNFADDVVWPASTITARGGLVYNATRGVAVGVLDFGVNKSSSDGEFRVRLPNAGFATSLVRVGRPGE